MNKNKEERLLTLLDKMSDLNFQLAKMAEKDGDVEMYHRYMGSANVYDNVIDMIKNEEHFSRTEEIFK